MYRRRSESRAFRSRHVDPIQNEPHPRNRPPHDMNVELLESVRQAIVYYPKRFCAAQWAFARNADRVLADDATPQGFKCCIAGHVLLESGRYDERDLLRDGGFHTGGALWERAADVLGIDRDRCRELFFPSQWDKPYKQDYYLCSKDEEATVTAAYLDYFMQKHGEATPDPTPQPVEDKLKERAPTITKGERAPVA